MSLNILQNTIASLFKRKGKEIINQKELELLASMELRWFEPQDARKIIELSKEAGLLRNEVDGLAINFDTDTIVIPIGFRPPKDLLSDLEQDSESLFMQVVNQICLKTGFDEKKVIAEINSKQVELNDLIRLEVIAILYAKEHNVDVDKFMDPVKKSLFES